MFALLALFLATATAPAPAQAAEKGVETISNTWYTMQAGSTPYGYFHEIIEKKKDRYSYRSEMLKLDGIAEFNEVVGALAEEDLTPVAFNIAKSGKGATEIANGTFSKRPSGGILNIEITGRKAAKFKRTISKGAILDVFFPVWVRKNWEKLKAGSKGYVYAFTEDPERLDFMQKTLTYKVVGMNTSEGCLNLKIDLPPTKADWCINREGQIISLSTSGVTVRKVKGEAEAKAFVAGVKKKK